MEYERAERWLGEGIEYAARTEQWNHRHYMVSHQAHVWWCRGRWEEASRAAQQLLTEGEGGITTRIIALHALGFVALGRGRVDAATRAAGRGARLGRGDAGAAALLPGPLGPRRVRAADRGQRRRRSP